MAESGAEQERWVRQTAGIFLWVEHAAYIALGGLLSLAALLGLAGATSVLIGGLADWSSTHALLEIMDRLLFVLMIVEILHTVRASMRTGALNSEPFLVVGLIATIRRVLVITLKSSETTKTDNLSDGAQRLFQSSMLELGVLSVLILVMVVSIRLLRPGSGRTQEDTPP
jgi:uncharacterized membrane protein (DUF373 family)